MFRGITKSLGTAAAIAASWSKTTEPFLFNILTYMRTYAIIYAGL